MAAIRVNNSSPGAVGPTTGIHSPVVIGVAGGTGCGKSSLAKRITQGLGAGNITELCHDYYYKDISHLSIEERAKTNFDHPNSLDTKLLINHLEKLKRGEAVEVPRYDFSTHSREIFDSHHNAKEHYSC